MLGSKEMRALQLRKRALLLESELNRLTLSTQFQNLPRWPGWTESLVNARRVAGPWLRVLAPVGGVVLALGICRASRLLVCFEKVATFVPPLIRIWRAVTASSTVTK